MSEVLIFGASSALACALAKRYAAAGYRVLGVGRTEVERGIYDDFYLCDYTDNALSELTDQLKNANVTPRVILCCVGVLLDDQATPEKRLEELNGEALAHYFSVNTVIPALIMKRLPGLLTGVEAPKVAFLSAQVGSIGDNQLGGWYGYRASKAALNMLIKTASIELSRRCEGSCVVALHPGTTRSPLSKPFAGRIPAHRLYSPDVSAARLFAVLQGLNAENTGQFYHWSGERLPW
ncbi:SDR family NAD(P)-dependent oxidoreductase [Gilvimarinus chinensis]|uniref:SDR family NAD(P)-dependent oxidoreductase n=1 Tax=Gilvimarinus chinensis TaxID=396005 RepID=UPI0003706060|nr:SDR family NAD(P)-dependent oxidoreductase [Gilvimarinus chinensis]